MLERSRWSILTRAFSLAGARRLSAAAVGLLALAFLGVACTSVSRSNLLERLHLCSSDEGPSEAYCGTFTVFEDRQAGSGRRIALKIVVLRSLSDDDRPDPLIFLAALPQRADHLRTVTS